MIKSRTFLRLSSNPGADESSEENDIFSRPPPTSNFIDYLQWAVLQLRLEFDLIINKNLQTELLPVLMEQPTKSRIKANRSLSNISSGISKVDQNLSPMHRKEDNISYITVTYDTCNNLVQLKFDKHSPKPRELLQIIRLIIHLYESLTKIVVEPPVQNYIPYELSKILAVSNITDVCLDGCVVEACNYYELLEGNCSLQKISLARCNITDASFKIICFHLTYPSPCSKSLRILNLTTNQITDVGAQYLADALRSNRQLVYLNLSDNMLTDEGVLTIFKIFTKFRLIDDDLESFRFRHMDYLHLEMKLMEQYLCEFKTENLDKKKRKGKVGTKRALKRRDSVKSCQSGTSSIYVEPVSSEYDFLERAKNKIEETLGEFTDPFSEKIEIDGVHYSPGNNSLQILNLSYNNLTFVSLKQLKNVLLYQKEADRRPLGLLQVCVNGNNIPGAECKEMMAIDDLFENALLTMQSFGKRSYDKKINKQNKKQ